MTTRTPTSPLAALRDRRIGRLMLALLLSETCAPAFMTALGIYAFGHGSASAVGLVGLACLLPGAMIAPFAGVLADRARPQRVMALSAALRALALAAIAGAMAMQAPVPLVAVLAALASLPMRVFRPAQMALLPMLAQSDPELAAGNALTGAIENTGTVAGPALGGALVVVGGPSAALVACAAGALAAALLVASIGASRTTEDPPGARRSELLAGAHAIASSAPLRLVVSLFAAETVVFGVLNVLIVDLALSDLAAGAGSVGLLTGMLGIGGILGGFAALAASNRLALGRQLSLGTLGWGLPLVVIALHATLTTAVLMLVLAGVGNVSVDVSAYTLIQRSAPAEQLGRVFGAFEGLCVASGAAGLALGGLLTDLLGARTMFAVAGAVVLGLAVATRQSLSRLDREPVRARPPVVALAVSER